MLKTRHRNLAVILRQLNYVKISFIVLFTAISVAVKKVSYIPFEKVSSAFAKRACIGMSSV